MSPSASYSTAMNDPMDGELLRKYLSGDEEAFRAFYERHRRPVFCYLLALVRTRERAEELHQETFCAMLRRLGAGGAEKLLHRDNMRPYLLRTARNQAIDALRREGRQLKALEEQRSAAWVRQDWSDGVESLLDGAATATEIQQQLDALPDEQREAVILKVIGELTFQEIGQLTQVPENTAVSRYRYGIRKLREALNSPRRGTSLCSEEDAQ